jgi:hypothetical protein
MKRADELSYHEKLSAHYLRDDNAYTVRREYLKEYVGSQCWVVMHPDEYDRCYLVDMLNRTCTCEDYTCFCHIAEIDCKHILALEKDWEELTGLKFEPRLKDWRLERPSLNVIAVLSDDPYSLD